MTELTEQMEQVAHDMAVLASRLLQELDDDHKYHGDELYGAACTLREWAMNLMEEKIEVNDANRKNDRNS